MSPTYANTMEQKLTTVVFEPAHYTIMEDVGSFIVTIKRQGGNMKNTVYVDYFTEDGTANAGSDYETAKGDNLSGVQGCAWVCVPVMVSC